MTCLYTSEVLAAGRKFGWWCRLGSCGFKFPLLGEVLCSCFEVHCFDPKTAIVYHLQV